MQRFYFDHNATTPVDKALLDVLVPVMVEDFGNASSIHYEGQRGRRRLDEARRQTAAFLHADPKEIVFTSGGTEADNLAIFGIVRASKRETRHVITTAIEHPAVLNACAQLEREGVEVTYIRPDSRGVVDPGDVRAAIRPDTVLISVMHVNNEVGTIQPLDDISVIGRRAGIPVHSDGVQAAGRIDCRSADLYSISAHKMYGPKGSGALFVRKGLDLQPLLHGGAHEQRRRAGTENVPGAVALGWCCSHPASDQTALRDRLEAAVLDRVPGVRINGGGAPRVGNTTNFSFEAIRAEAMVIALDLKGFSVSTGSACSSGAVEASHVLTAMGLSAEDARSSIRVSLGKSNTEEQVDALAVAIGEAAEHLRRLSPVSLAHA